MKALGTLIHTTDFDFRVYAVLLRERATMRQSLAIYIVSPIGEMSAPVTLTRQSIICHKNTLDFFFNMDGDFEREDIDKIKNSLWELLKKGASSYSDIQGRGTMSEIHTTISAYIRQNAEELSDNPNTCVFIQKNIGYINTDALNDFVKATKVTLDYSRIEILKRLKIMGALQPATNRPFDTLVSINGHKKRFYKIELAQPSTDAEHADEEITVPALEKGEII